MDFSIAPDSVIKSCEWRGRPRYMDAVWLIWLVWLLGPLIFGAWSHFSHWLWPTAASVPVFLALYWRAHTCPRRQIVGYAIGITLLAALVAPVNPYAETYLVYACAVAGCWNPPRRSFGLMLALMVGYGVEWMLLQYPWQFLVNIWVICLLIGGVEIYKQTEQRRLAELRLSHDEIRRLAASAERERIGRDLHDLLGHTLSLVALKSELAGRLIERDPHAARREIADVERVARDALSQVRSAVSGIRAAALVSELASARLLLETAGVHVTYRQDCDDLPADVETCLALALREAVTNIERHARAGNVEIDVERDGDAVRMRIRDDGRGGVSAHGNGLAGMRERVQAMDGKLAIDSPRACGTTLEVTLPLRDAAKECAPRVALPATAVPVAQAFTHASGRT